MSAAQIQTKLDVDSPKQISRNCHSQLGKRSPSVLRWRGPFRLPYYLSCLVFFLLFNVSYSSFSISARSPRAKRLFVCLGDIFAFASVRMEIIYWKRKFMREDLSVPIIQIFFGYFPLCICVFENSRSPFMQWDLVSTFSRRNTIRLLFQQRTQINFCNNNKVTCIIAFSNVFSAEGQTFLLEHLFSHCTELRVETLRVVACAPRLGLSLLNFYFSPLFLFFRFFVFSLFRPHATISLSSDFPRWRSNWRPVYREYEQKVIDSTDTHRGKSAKALSNSTITKRSHETLYARCMQGNNTYLHCEQNLNKEVNAETYIQNPHTKCKKLLKYPMINWEKAQGRVWERNF